MSSRPPLPPSADGPRRTSYRESENDLYVEKTASGDEVYVFNPYNAHNVQITPEEVQALLKVYGVSAPIANFELYRRAFVHRSYIRRPDAENAQNNIVVAEPPAGALRLSSKSNERLEFVGDGILECITKYYLYRRFPKENEGFMTEKKIALVKNEAIGAMAHEMGLHRWFVISAHAEAKGTRANTKKLGCLFEAFLGALFLDFNKISVADEHGWFRDTFLTGPGFQMAQVFIERVFERHVDWDRLIRHDDNYKNILQVIVQKAFKTTPDYMEAPCAGARGAEAGDAGWPGYSMGVYLCLGQPAHAVRAADALPLSRFASVKDVHAHMGVHGRVLILLGKATNKVKKCAEQAASQDAIARMGAW